MADMFANALAYEDMMGRWSARLAPLFADFAQIKDGGRVLDVGCGTGSLVRTVAAMAPRSEIVGFDPAQPFIDYARAQFADSRISFDRANAMDLPYPAASFDYAVSLLVLMFIPQPEKAASEMRRVTRAGGTVAAYTWDRDGLEMTSAFWEEAAKMDPNAEARSERPRHSNREGQLAALWHKAGLERIDGLHTQVDIGIEEGLKHESSIHCDELMSLSKSSLTSFIGSLSPAKQALPDRALAFALGLTSDMFPEGA